jgi:hypothetical protein
MNATNFFTGALLIALVLTVVEVLIQPFFHARAVRIHARKLADRRARGEDRYFEELRTLEAYAPPPLPAGSLGSFSAIYAQNYARVILAIGLIALLRWMQGLPLDPFA